MKRTQVVALFAATLLLMALSGSSAAFDFNSNNDTWTAAGLYDDGGLTPLPAPWFGTGPAGWTAAYGSPSPGAILIGSGGMTFPASPTGSAYLHWDLNSPDLSASSEWQGMTSFSYNVGDYIWTSQAIYVQAVLRARKPDNTIGYFSDGLFNAIPTNGSWQTYTANVAAFGMPAGRIILNINLRIFHKPGSGIDGFVLVDHVVPTGGGSKTCQGKCGGQGTGGCWCDPACKQYGDCCPDYDQICQVAKTCQGKCGGQGVGGCWCDAACKNYGDCCPDYEGRCGSFACSPPGVCGNYQSCGGCGYCNSLAEGGGVCIDSQLCLGLTACTGSSGCPAGYICSVGTCCPGMPNVCVPLMCIPGAPVGADGQAMSVDGETTTGE